MVDAAILRGVEVNINHRDRSQLGSLYIQWILTQDIALNHVTHNLLDHCNLITSHPSILPSSGTTIRKLAQPLFLES